MVTKTEILSALQFPLINQLNPINDTGAPRQTITYQYAGTALPDDLPSSTAYTGWTAFTAVEKTAFQAALAHIETFLNVTFEEVTGSADPDLNAGKVTLPSGISGYGGYYATYYTSTNTFAEYDSYVVYDNALDVSTRPNLLLHELGHALGLKHPFDAPTLPSDMDNNKYTVMSYTANPDNGVDSDAMMLFDVFALQNIWGAADYNTGNTTYTGSRTDTVDAIWDTGGRNTFDASTRSTDVALNLRQGAFSSFDDTDDVVITYGTRIKDAIGGAGDDTLTGNGMRNLLKGNGGNDRLIGANGDDRLKGNGGNDTLLGGRNDDRLFGGTGNDRLIGANGDDLLRGHGGNDTLRGGRNDDTLFGGTGDDTLKGNGNDDSLYGGGGSDLLIGGWGHDTIQGNRGGDVLKGFDGRDKLFGGGGDDTLRGGKHKDTLHGQIGDDTLYGGGGADTFIYRVNGGKDTVVDFKDDIDTLRFSKLGDVATVIATATEVGTDVVFDFGGGDILTVLDTTVNALSDDIIV